MTSRSSSRRRGSPRRRVSNAAARRSILVFTEGEKTEVAYLEAWVRANRERVVLKIDERHGYSPLEMVKLAVELRKADRRSERRGEGAAWPELWCVFDVDEHPHLQQAINLARGNGINLAISNPCFELWLVLHDRDQQAWISRNEVQALAESIFHIRKTLNAGATEQILAGLDDAIERARKLGERHLLDGNDRNENPSSGMGELMSSLQTKQLGPQ